MTTAASKIPLYDLRRKRAMSLTVALMQEIRDLIPMEFDERSVGDRIFDVLYMNGAAWTTDEERSRFGFEPRDELGWTPSERVAQKQRELEVLQMLQTVVLKRE